MRIERCAREPAACTERLATERLAQSPDVLGWMRGAKPPPRVLAFGDRPSAVASPGAFMKHRRNLSRPAPRVVTSAVVAASVLAAWSSAARAETLMERGHYLGNFVM